MAKIPHRLYLTEDQMPKQWYNLRADMKEKPDPLIHPGTRQPLAEQDLYPIFCEKLAHQELDNDTRYIDIPEPVLDMYKLYRPSPRRPVLPVSAGRTRFLALTIQKSTLFFVKSVDFLIHSVQILPRPASAHPPSESPCRLSGSAAARIHPPF